MMENLPLALFSRVGGMIVWTLLLLAVPIGVSGLINLFRPAPFLERRAGQLLLLLAGIFLAGFLWTGWFHYQIYLLLPLELPAAMAEQLNRRLIAMNQGATYGLPLYSTEAPPRYLLPLWLDNEKYYFWFMAYAGMALLGHYRLADRRFRAALHLLLRYVGVGPGDEVFCSTFTFVASANPIPMYLNTFIAIPAVPFI